MGCTGKNDRHFLSDLPRPLGLGPPFSEVHKKLLFGFILKLNLVDYAFSRPFPRNPFERRFPSFYRMGGSHSKSGIKCVQETKPRAWRKALLPLVAKLEEEEKVNMTELEEEDEKVVTELEKLKVKVPRFTKEFILVLYLHYSMSDMWANIFHLKKRRCYLSDEAYKKGGEMALKEAMMAKEKEFLAKIYKMSREKPGLKGKLKRRFEEVEVPDDKIPN